jgi:hypothetical protein
MDERIKVGNVYLELPKGTLITAGLRDWTRLAMRPPINMGYPRRHIRGRIGDLPVWHKYEIIGANCRGIFLLRPDCFWFPAYCSGK